MTYLQVQTIPVSYSTLSKSHVDIYQVRGNLSLSDLIKSFFHCFKTLHTVHYIFTYDKYQKYLELKTYIVQYSNVYRYYILKICFISVNSQKYVTQPLEQKQVYFPKKYQEFQPVLKQNQFISLIPLVIS